MAHENDRTNPSPSFPDEDSLILAQLLKRNYKIVGLIFLALALALFLVISIFGPAYEYLRLFVLVPPIFLITGIFFFATSYLESSHLLRMQRWVTGSKLFEHQKRRAKQMEESTSKNRSRA